MGFRTVNGANFVNATEALDARVYARAAASALGIDRFGEATWQKLERALGRSVVTASDTSDPQKTATPPLRSGWSGAITYGLHHCTTRCLASGHRERRPAPVLRWQDSQATAMAELKSSP